MLPAELLPMLLPALIALAGPAVVIHFLMAVPLFSIAKRRGLWWRWMAWVPIGQNYVLGAIADDITGAGGYRMYRNGEEIRQDSYFRYILSGYQIIIAFVGALMAFRAWRIGDMSALYLQGPLQELISTAAPIVSFVLAGVHAFALYKIFGYYRPHRASLYAVLCVFFPIVTPFLLFSVRGELLRREKSRGQRL